MHASAGAGRVIGGRYRLRDLIGRGAMGAVWRARDELLDRDVAVKEVQVPPALGEQERTALYQRTLREAKTAARLNHPGVVTVFDVVEEGGRPWIVMELVRARSLDQVLAQDGPLAVSRAADIGHQLVGALATAHAAGVLHRDVKPSNVLLAPDGRAVLTDFGIATFEGDERLTQTGMVMGTPAFTPPERIRGDPATPASDLWSLGATLYAAVQGRGPYQERGSAFTTMNAVLHEDAPAAPSAGQLGPVITALMQKDPAARPDAATASLLLSGALRDPGPGAGSAAFSPASCAASPSARWPDSSARWPDSGARWPDSGARWPDAGVSPPTSWDQPAMPASSWPAPDAVPTSSAAGPSYGIRSAAPRRARPAAHPATAPRSTAPAQTRPAARPGTAPRSAAFPHTRPSTVPRWPTPRHTCRPVPPTAAGSAQPGRAGPGPGGPPGAAGG